MKTFFKVFLFFSFLVLPVRAFAVESSPEILPPAQGFQPAKTTQSLQQGVLSVAPFIFEEVMEKGQVLEREIEVRNLGAESLPITMSINDFVPAGTQGQVRFLGINEDSDPKFSISSWLKIVDQPEFIIPAFGKTSVKFNINPPIGAEPGTHYGGLLFGLEIKDVSVDGPKISQKVGALVIVTLGQAKEDGEISSFTVNPNWQSAKDIEFSVTFKNNGNVRVVPRGEIDIRNIFGKVVASGYINRDGGLVFPKNERNFVTKLPKSFLLGYYTVEGWVQFGNPKQEQRLKIPLWFIPTKLIILSLFALIVFAILCFVGIRRYNKYLFQKVKNKFISK